MAIGAFVFEAATVSCQEVWRADLSPSGLPAPFHALALRGTQHGRPFFDGCGATAGSAAALVRRLRKLLTGAEPELTIGIFSDVAIGPVAAGEWRAVRMKGVADPWKGLARSIQQFAAEQGSARLGETDLAASGKGMAYRLACSLFGIDPTAGAIRRFALRVRIDPIDCTADLDWSDLATGTRVALGMVRFCGPGRVVWKLEVDGAAETANSGIRKEAIAEAFERWRRRFPFDSAHFSATWRKPGAGGGSPEWEEESPFGPGESPVPWIVASLAAMAERQHASQATPGLDLAELEFLGRSESERFARREQRRREKLVAAEERRAAAFARAAQQRQERDRRAAQRPVPPPPPPAPRPRLPVPPVAVTLRLPALAAPESQRPLIDLAGYSLRERAAAWWVSNQSDDLLCVPHCRIERLDYQVRAALRVIGPLQGRALLSDEVGLGKTVEAGLVLKELLTRGMVKRFLVLTLPSLVDQWAEELLDKFGLATATSNDPALRTDPRRFWQEHAAIVASLHTLKQPAHLACACEGHWDLLIVDEAHYLRNRTSQAWQAVNALPRQFLLLLTATPVQNSLEELYNLVTLLKPGQLPSPREFRARFIDPRKPHRPRDPEELRRLLGQVMIRNTRASAGVKLPPRRAATVLFEPDSVEAGFWQQWDGELRASLARLTPSQASLWGRLLLQAAGSSPAAWRAALQKYPEASAAAAWRERAPLDGSWLRKCALLVPLTRLAGGAVIFTQFLETQAALAGFLRGAGVPTVAIHGGTPAAERQPLTEAFRRDGGALLLTHSGTEGRNLQFCHCLINFDLPWNPLEIEQRIGRLHRLGQTHPVEIHNFVQAGTLQEHLLALLQDKLNLFELVVGETGLVLGERFGGDEFAEGLFRCWQEHEGAVQRALETLGDELAAARAKYGEIQQLDETLFARDFESL